MAKYLSLVPSVIKLWSIFLGLGCLSMLHAQKPSQDASNPMEQQAKALLARELNYTNTQTLLSESLRDLAHRSQINIVFSESTLGSSTTKAIPDGRRSIQNILELLLADTWFDYLVVGQTVAIVTATKQAIAPQSDSTKTLISKHILTYSNHSFDHIPARERRMMRKVLLQELEKSQLRIVEKKDTTFVEPLQPYPQFKIYGQLGLPLYTIQNRSRATHAWKNDLSYKSHAKTSLSYRAGIEVHREKYYFCVGVSFQELDLAATWIDSSEIPPVEVPPPAPAGKPKYKDALDQYLILSLPLSFGYPIRFKTHRLIPNVGLSYAYVRYGKRSPKKFEKYYKLKNPDAKYTEQVFRHLLAANIGLGYEYEITRYCSFKSNIEYSLFVNPIASNSLFKTLPHHLSMHLGISYSLD